MSEDLNNTIIDMVSNFLYYDRKEDEDLPVGRIDEMIHSGETSVDEIVDKFRSEMERGVRNEYN